MVITSVGVIGFYSFAGSFVYCEISECMSSTFDGLYDEFKQFEFYLLPADLQRSMVIIINTMQQPIIIHGFGNVPCSRETFKKV